MRKKDLAILNISLADILKAFFMILMSLQISIGPLVEYSDGIQIVDIELAEEEDSEQKEKKEKEEIEKDEFLSKLFFCALSSQEKFQLYTRSTRNWNATKAEVPTPPPRHIVA
jgi:hypothetical protein